MSQPEAVCGAIISEKKLKRNPNAYRFAYIYCGLIAHDKQPFCMESNRTPNHLKFTEFRLKLKNILDEVRIQRK